MKKISDFDKVFRNRDWGKKKSETYRNKSNDTVLQIEQYKLQ